MFGRGKSGYKAPKITTIIGHDSKVVGDVSFSGGLHIDGAVRGNVSGIEGSDSLLIVSEAGSIEGEVHVSYVILNGNVRGDVYATDRVELASRARVTGNVYYHLLEMEIGAEVNGNLVHDSGEPVMLGYEGDAGTMEPTDVSRSGG